MKRLLLALALAWASPALAVVPSTQIGDAAYTILNTDTNLTTGTVFTAGRTWTLPSANATCIGQNCIPAANSLSIADTAAAFSQAFPLTLAPPSGNTINGNAANLIIAGAGARITLVPTSSSNWNATVDGDFQTTGICPPPATTATVTITIATPGVITWTAHGITGACPVVFTTSSSLPTGITASTVYYVSPGSITTNTFSISTTVANALAGTLIATSGSQAGTQTGTGGVSLSTGTAADVTGLSLSQGKWDCRAKIGRTLGASTSVTKLVGGISATTATAATIGSTASTVTMTAANVMGAAGTDSTIGPNRVTMTATTNRFLVAQDTFTVSTNVAYGTLTCERLP